MRVSTRKVMTKRSVSSDEPVPAESEIVPGLAEAPLLLRLTYVGDMLRSLKGLAGEHELRLLHLFLAMAIDETDDRAKALRAEAD